MRALVLVLVLGVGVGVGVVAGVGCGGGAAPPVVEPTTPSVDALPAESKLGAELLLGQWRAEDGSSAEQWVRVGDVMFGLGVAVAHDATRWFEVMVIHRDGERVVLTAMPGGVTSVDFARRSHTTDEIEFANPEHDHPQHIVYRRTRDGMAVRVTGNAGESTTLLQAAEVTPAPSLETADREFDADNAERGGAAWAARFAEDGVNWARGGERTEGRDAIARGIDELVEQGASLRWQPTASVLSPAGDLGMTCGEYRVERDGKAVGTGVYASIWRRNHAGTWQIVFDTGLPMHGTE